MVQGGGLMENIKKRIDCLTTEQKSQMESWVRDWIAIGLSTDRANWAHFAKAARDCYRFAKLNPDVPIIQVPSPMVGAFAATIAASIIQRSNQRQSSAVGSGVRSAVDAEVDSAVGSAVGSAVRSAVDSAV